MYTYIHIYINAYVELHNISTLAQKSLATSCGDHSTVAMAKAINYRKVFLGQLRRDVCRNDLLRELAKISCPAPDVGLAHIVPAQVGLRLRRPQPRPGHL